jgi:dTDP-4-amino-4,6-dideoxygalactose transaminase
MRLHGISQDAFNRYTSRTPAWFYEVVAAGFKYNLTDIASAIGIAQLRKIDRFLAAPPAAGCAATTKPWPACRCACRRGPSGGSTHAWHLYVVRLTPERRMGATS